MALKVIEELQDWQDLRDWYTVYGSFKSSRRPPVYSVERAKNSIIKELDTEIEGFDNAWHVLFNALVNEYEFEDLNTDQLSLYVTDYEKFIEDYLVLP